MGIVSESMKKERKKMHIEEKYLKLISQYI